MKKTTLTIFIFCIFASGFRGCVDEHIFDVLLFALTSGSTYGLDGSNGFSDTYYIAAGENGKIYTSPDSSTLIWTERPSGTTNNINSLANTELYDTTITFGVGNNGTIIRSLDKGHSWTVLNSNTTQDLYGICFIGLNDTMLIAVGAAGTILKTSNCGNNWTNINSGTSKNLNSVISQSSFGILAAVGDDGVILRSSNSGNNWQNISLPDTITDLNKIGGMGVTFLGYYYGIVGDNGKLYRSSSDLASWLPIMTNSNSNFKEIVFKNASSGYLCGENGAVIYTTNSGNNWYTDFTIQSIFTEDINSSLLIDDTTAMVASGTNIYVLSTEESILPVELTSFTSVISSNDVTLNWVTSTEINNSGFYIERKKETNDWTNIGFVNGFGTTTEPSAYKYTDKNVPTGNYNYRLKQTDYNGIFEYFYLNNEIVIGLPDKFSLSQNYPNPFNPSTIINYELPSDEFVSLKLYDILGKEVFTIVNENQSGGSHSVVFNATDHSAGMYFYKIEAGAFKDVRRMMIIK